MLFGITGSGDLYAFDTSGILQPIFNNGATSVSTGLSGATGLAFSNLDVKPLARDDRPRSGTPATGSMACSTIPFTRPPGVPFTRATPGGTSLYFGNEPTASAANNSYGGLAGGAHGTVETNSFSLAGYSGDGSADLVLQLLPGIAEPGCASSPARAPMLDSMRVSIWNSDAGRWELLTTNNSARDSGEYTSEYDYQLPPGTTEDRYIQEAFNFDRERANGGKSA